MPLRAAPSHVMMLWSTDREPVISLLHFPMMTSRPTMWYDLDEAIAFAADGKVRSEFTTAPLAEINAIFERMKSGKIDGRVVLDFGQR